MTPAEISAEFLAALAGHDACLRGLGEVGTEIHTAKKALVAVQRVLRQMGNDALVNNVLDGKNAEIRAAQLANILNADPSFQKATDQENALTLELDDFERDAVVHGYRARGAELRMQFAIEQFRYLNTPRFYRDLPA